MANLGEAFVQIVADMSRFASSAQKGVADGLKGVTKEFDRSLGDMVKSAEKRFKEVGKAFDQSGKALSRNVTAPIVGLGAAGIKTAMDFESSFAQIEGLVGVSGEELERLRLAAGGLGPNFGKSAQEAADALFFITSAGLRGNEALEVLSMSLKASQVGLGDVSTIADLTTSVINAYGSETMSAANATDILTAAVREGKLEPAELSGAMGQVLPVASAMGIQFDEVGAAFAAMSRTGTGASEAATQLRGIMTSLLKPTTQAEDALAEMGLSSEGLRDQIREQGLLSVLETLTDTFADNEVGAEAVFGNVRALSGVLDLMGSNAEGTRQIFDNMSDSTGILNEAFAVTAETAQFKFDQSMEQIKDSVRELGEVLMPIFTEQVLPALQRVGDFVQDLAFRFNELSERNRNLILAAIGVAAALGPVLIIVGKLIQAVGFVVQGVRVFASIVGTLSNALWFVAKTVVPLLLKGLVLIGKGLFVLGKVLLANPLFLLAAAIAGIVFIIFRFREQIVDAFKKAFEFVADVFTRFFDWAKEAFNNFVQGVKDVFSPVVDFFADIFTRVFDTVRNAFNSIVDWFKEWWPLLLAVFALPIFAVLAIWNKWGDEIKAFFIAVWDFIKGIVETAGQLVVDAVKFYFGLVKRFIIEPLQAAFEWVFERFMDVLRFIGDILLKVVNAVRDRFNAVLSFVRDVWGRIRDAVVGAASALFDSVSDWFGRIRDRIGGALGEALDAVKATIGQWVNFGGDIIQGIIRGIGNAAGALFNSLKNLARGALDAAKGALGISSPSKVFATVGENIIEGMTVGMRREMGGALKELEQFANAASGSGTIRTLVSASGLPQSSVAGSANPLAAAVSGGSRNVTVNVYGEVRAIDEERLATLLRRQELLEGVR